MLSLRALCFALLLLAAAVVHAGNVPSNNAAYMMDIMLDLAIKEGKNASLACKVSGGYPGFFTPVGVARGYRAVSVAMYDAWSRFDNNADPVYATSVERVAADQRTDANKAAAVVYAAYQTIVYLLPEKSQYENLIGTTLSRTGVDPTANLASLPATVATSAANALKTFLASDGFNQAGCYADTTNYVPINPPTNFMNLTTVTDAMNTNSRAKYSWSQIVKPGFIDAPRGFLTPQAGLAKSFTVNPASILPPPIPNATVLAQQFQAVVDYQSQLDNNNGKLRVVAEFWADGPQSSLPPGHWIEITMDVASQKSYNLDHTVRVLFLVSNALYDGGIACWFAKRVYNSVRPATFIPEFLYSTPNDTIPLAFRGPYCPSGSVQAWQWTPYQAAKFVTPPFPEYVSGHSTFSRAAAESLAYYTNSVNFPTPYQPIVKAGLSLFEPQCNSTGLNMYGTACVYKSCSTDGTKTSENYFWPTADITIGPFTSYKDAADEAGISRLYGGIHIQAGDIEGRALGAKVASLTTAAACSYMKLCNDTATISSSASPAASLDAILGSLI